MKVGARRRKKRRKTNISSSWLSTVPLCDPRLMEATRQLGEMGVACTGSLLPAFLIRYQRLRFTDPARRTRVSLDFDISVPRVNSQMLPRVNQLPLSVAVLEVKGDRPELPGAMHQLTSLGCRKEPFSKYLACYEMTTGQTL